MADLLDLASLDSYLYTPGTSSLQSIDDGAWAPLNNIAPNPDISGPYGFYAEAFKNSQTGEIVIAIRGTVPTMVANIAEDLELGLVSKYAPVMNAIANDAITFAKEVAKANPGATITLTGHSLGGYAAQAALVRLTQAGTANVSAVTFNAPGLPTWFLGSADPASFNSYNFNTQGDIIHTYGGTQIGESTILDVGPSPAQEMIDYSAGFLAGIGFGAKGAEATGLAYVAYKDWFTAAHTIGNFVGTNSYTGQQGIFSANTALGSETAQQFFADGQQIPPSPQLSVSPDGTISLSDTAGDVLSVQAVDGNLQGSLTAGSGLGVSNLSGLQSELQADGPGVVSQDQLNSGATSLPGGSSLFGTLTTGLGGDTSAVIGSEAPGGSAGLPGQLYVPEASSDGRYECNMPVTGTVSEVIDSNGAGTVWVDSSIGYGQLTGGSAVPGTPGTWKDNNGTQYTFSGSLSSSIGTLTITGGLLGTNPADSITIQNFNLAAAATSPEGFLGISLAYTLSLTAGTGAGSGSSATFPAGSEQSYTLSADAPSGSPETVVLTLAGANPSDFEVQIGDTIEELDPSGAFTVTLPVGATGVSFGLIDVTPDNGTSDIADGTTLTLTASVANPTNPNGSPIQSSPLSITYTPQTPDTSTVSTPGDVISGTLSGGVTTYQGDGGDDYISAGQGPNDILAQNSGSDSIIGGSGDNTVYGGSGNDVIDLNGSNDLVSLGDGFNTVNGSSSGKDSIYGHGGTSIINANGGTDLIFGGNGTNQVYAGTGA